MNPLVNEINKLITATHIAQSKGAYTLKQSMEIYNTIQKIQQIFSKANSVSKAQSVSRKKNMSICKTKLSTISEKSELLE